MARFPPLPRKPYADVVIAAPITIPYARYSTKAAQWWIGRALAALARQAGLAHTDFDGLSVSSFTLSPDTAIGLTQHFGVSPRWLDYVPLGGASGIVALRKAARAVEAGDCTLAACIAGDTNHVDSFRRMLSNFSRFARDATYPYGSGGPNASFALIMRSYMQASGATRADFGKLAVAQRANALAVPHALFKKPLTLEEYLSARPIADPIHLYDCVMPCAGAEAFLVMREETARSLGLPFVRLLASIERHNAYAGDVMQLRGGWASDCRELYAMAGVSPEDIDFIETYDDYPFVSMMQMEDLGLCKKGEAAEFVRSRDFGCAGDMPHNTSGGQLSVGQAGCAGGFLGLVEAVRQLTGFPLGGRVNKARLGLVSGFGMITYDRGLASAAAVLAKA
jgi:acetyl-CoA acetyltransferase